MRLQIVFLIFIKNKKILECKFYVLKNKFLFNSILFLNVMKYFGSRYIVWILCIVISVSFLFGGIFFHIHYFSNSRIYKKQGINTPLSAPVAIVFGAAVYSSGPSPMFSDRLTVALNLYKSGMVRKILISGDNSSEYYNEPQSGKDFLLKKGVKSIDILLDYAGFRSYDTCIRAKRVFSIDSAIVVTQEFHLPRVVFLCSHTGIETIGVSADMREYYSMYKNYFREFFAIQLAFYQAYFLDYQPKFLGEEEPIDSN